MSPMSHYELRDAGGKSVARTRTRAAAHRTSRKATHLGASVNRVYGDRTFSELNVGRTFWFTAKRTTVRGATYKQNRGPYVKVSEQRYRDLDDAAGKFLYEVSRRSVSVTTTPPDANRAGGGQLVARGDGLYHYGPAKIAVSGPSGGLWWASVSFRDAKYDFKDFSGSSRDAALRAATDWVDNMSPDANRAGGAGKYTPPGGDRRYHYVLWGALNPDEQTLIRQNYYPHKGHADDSEYMYPVKNVSGLPGFKRWKVVPSASRYLSGQMNRAGEVWGLGKLPPNVLLHHSPSPAYPKGAWGFVGSVDSRLGYVSKDGSEATAKQLSDAASFGPALAGVKSRSFRSKREALAFARSIGVEVSHSGKHGGH